MNPSFLLPLVKHLRVPPPIVILSLIGVTPMNVTCNTCMGAGACSTCMGAGVQPSCTVQGSLLVISGHTRVARHAILAKFTLQFFCVLFIRHSARFTPSSSLISPRQGANLLTWVMRWCPYLPAYGVGGGRPWTVLMVQTLVTVTRYNQELKVREIQILLLINSIYYNFFLYGIKFLNYV